MQDMFNLSSEVKIPTKKILLIEDEIVFARAVKKHLERSGFKVKHVEDLSSSRLLLKQFEPDLILLDMRLPDGSGLDLLSEIKPSLCERLSILVMSAYGELEDAVSAMKLGASDYLKKPIDLEELLINVKKVLDKNLLTQKLTYSNKREQYAVDKVKFLGDCDKIIAVRKQAERIAKLSKSSNIIPPTVLLLGETGTGKDVVAHLLHNYSSRVNKPFVHVDCASLPKDLIEAELFGHEKGSFTNAHVARAGLIEAAEDGVLFLDEIGELPINLQSKLLSVLERRTLRRIGTTQERSVAAWIIAATNRDLSMSIDKGEFRSDLYYRLNVMSLFIPALRDRGEDILLLAEYFAEKTAKRYGINFAGFSADINEILMSYDWPGNVREMRHLIERAILLSDGKPLTSGLLGVEFKQREKKYGIDIENNTIDNNLTLNEVELSLIKKALQRTNGNISKAARELNITRMALRYRIKKYNLL